jgi:hypothetical protein
LTVRCFGFFVGGSIVQVSKTFRGGSGNTEVLVLRVKKTTDEDGIETIVGRARKFCIDDDDADAFIVAAAWFCLSGGSKKFIKQKLRAFGIHKPIYTATASNKFQRAAAFVDEKKIGTYVEFREQYTPIAAEAAWIRCADTSKYDDIKKTAEQSNKETARRAAVEGKSYFLAQGFNRLVKGTPRSSAPVWTSKAVQEWVEGSVVVVFVDDRDGVFDGLNDTFNTSELGYAVFPKDEIIDDADFDEIKRSGAPDRITIDGLYTVDVVAKDGVKYVWPVEGGNGYRTYRDFTEAYWKNERGRALGEKKIVVSGNGLEGWPEFLKECLIPTFEEARKQTELAQARVQQIPAVKWLTQSERRKAPAKTKREKNIEKIGRYVPDAGRAEELYQLYIDDKTKLDAVNIREAFVGAATYAELNEADRPFFEEASFDQAAAAASDEHAEQCIAAAELRLAEAYGQIKVTHKTVVQALTTTQAEAETGDTKRLLGTKLGLPPMVTADGHVELDINGITVGSRIGSLADPRTRCIVFGADSVTFKTPESHGAAVTFEGSYTITLTDAEGKQVKVEDFVGAVRRLVKHYVERTPEDDDDDENDEDENDDDDESGNIAYRIEAIVAHLLLATIVDVLPRIGKPAIQQAIVAFLQENWKAIGSLAAKNTKGNIIKHASKETYLRAFEGDGPIRRIPVMEEILKEATMCVGAAGTRQSKAEFIIEFVRPPDAKRRRKSTEQHSLAHYLKSSTVEKVLRGCESIRPAFSEFKGVSVGLPGKYAVHSARRPTVEPTAGGHFIEAVPATYSFLDASGLPIGTAVSAIVDIQSFYKRTDAAAAVVKWLETQDEPKTVEQATKALKWTKAKMKRCLEELAERGSVAKERISGTGAGPEAYAAVKQTDEHPEEDDGSFFVDAVNNQIVDVSLGDNGTVTDVGPDAPDQLKKLGVVVASVNGVQTAGKSSVAIAELIGPQPIKVNITVGCNTVATFTGDIAGLQSMRKATEASDTIDRGGGEQNRPSLERTRFVLKSPDPIERTWTLYTIATAAANTSRGNRKAIAFEGIGKTLDGTTMIVVEEKTIGSPYDGADSIFVEGGIVKKRVGQQLEKKPGEGDPAVQWSDKLAPIRFRKFYPKEVDLLKGAISIQRIQRRIAAESGIIDPVDDGINKQAVNFVATCIRWGAGEEARRRIIPPVVRFDWAVASVLLRSFAGKGEPKTAFTLDKHGFIVGENNVAVTLSEIIAAAAKHTVGITQQALECIPPSIVEGELAGKFTVVGKPTTIFSGTVVLHKEQPVYVVRVYGKDDAIATVRPTTCSVDYVGRERTRPPQDQRTPDYDVKADELVDKYAPPNDLVIEKATSIREYFNGDGIPKPFVNSKDFKRYVSHWSGTKLLDIQKQESGFNPEQVHAPPMVGLLYLKSSNNIATIVYALFHEIGVEPIYTERYDDVDLEDQAEDDIAFGAVIAGPKLEDPKVYRAEIIVRPATRYSEAKITCKLGKPLAKPGSSDIIAAKAAHCAIVGRSSMDSNADASVGPTIGPSVGSSEKIAEFIATLKEPQDKDPIVIAVKKVTEKSNGRILLVKAEATTYIYSPATGQTYESPTFINDAYKLLGSELTAFQSWATE